MILPKGNNTKINKKMGKYILDNYPKLSPLVIAKKIGINSYSSIINFLKLNNVQIVPVGYFQKGKIAFNRKVPSIEILKNDYFVLKMKIKEISKKYQTSITAVRLQFKKHNVNLDFNKWSQKNLKKEALKYKTKSEFVKLSGGAYNAARKIGILDKITSHMQIQGTLYKRFVYIYQFSDNSVYVGITLNKKQRHLQHLTKGVAKNKTILKYKVSKLLPAQEALDLEQKMVDLFKANNYIVLNKAKCFSLGYIKKIWTKDKIITAAKSCKTRTEFHNKFKTAYITSKKENYYEQIVKHMPKNIYFKKFINLSTGKAFYTIKSASLVYNISSAAILKALRNKTKCCGCYWKYVK